MVTLGAAARKSKLASEAMVDLTVPLESHLRDASAHGIPPQTPPYRSQVPFEQAQTYFPDYSIVISRTVPRLSYKQF